MPSSTWFESILVSGEDGLIKPDPRIFELLLERIGRPAGGLHLHRRQSQERRGRGGARLRCDPLREPRAAAPRISSARERWPRAGLTCAASLRWLGCGLLGPADPAGSAALGGGYLWLRQSLPQIDGEIAGRGARARRSRVVRDRWAIPHIEAASLRDAQLRAGLRPCPGPPLADGVPAPARRRAAGRDPGRRRRCRPTASCARSGFYRLRRGEPRPPERRRRAPCSRPMRPASTPISRRARGPLPPEFLILRHDALEPWSPADSLVWLRLMALDLCGQLPRRAAARPARQAALGRADRRHLAGLARRARRSRWPRSRARLPFDGARRRPAARAAAGPGLQRLGASPAAGPRAARRCSPTIPHLGLQAPGRLVPGPHLEAPELELIGATLPGVPGIVLGHNGSIAWGFTNTGPDTQDLFVERLDPADPGRYLTPDGSAPFEVREEVIGVKDGAPVTFEVRATRHGPVLSDLLPDAERLFERRPVRGAAWTALAEDDRTAAGAARAQPRARLAGLRRGGARTSARRCRTSSTPTPRGHIGFIAPGRVPVRAPGRRPLAGAGLERRVRLAGLDPVRGAAARARPAGRPSVQRQQPRRAGGLPLSADRRLGGRPTARAGSPSCSTATATISRASRRSRPISCRCWRDDLLPIMLEAEPLSPAAARGHGARSRPGTG